MAPYSGDTFTHLFDWEKDPQRQEKIINARIEAELDGIDTALSTVKATNTALAAPQYAVAAASGDLTAERVLTDTATVTWDFATAGQAKANAAASAPTDAQYVTLATNGTLTNERVLTAGNGVTLTDAGAGSTITVATTAPWRLILSQEASSSATIDFTQSNAASAFDGTYKRLVLVMSNIKPATDDVELWLRIGTGGTPTYQTSGYDHIRQYMVPGTDRSPSATAAAQIAIGGGDLATHGIGNATGEKYSGVLYADSPDLSNFMNVRHDGSFTAATGGTATIYGGGAYQTSGAITALRLLMESGNIASGTFTLYGVKHT
jgi:hypothetical protein